MVIWGKGVLEVLWQSGGGYLITSTSNLHLLIFDFKRQSLMVSTIAEINLLVAAAPAAVGATAHIIAVSLAPSVAVLVHTDLQALRVVHVARLSNCRPAIFELPLFSSNKPRAYCFIPSFHKIFKFNYLYILAVRCSRYFYFIIIYLFLIRVYLGDGI